MVNDFAPMVPIEGVRIAGIARLRNEAHMIWSTLEHMAAFCNAGIFIYDDASTDNTVDICRTHDAVKGIITNEEWESNRAGRQSAEGTLRALALSHARTSVQPDWVYCFDADEFPSLNLTKADLEGKAAVWLRLWDFHITPEDKHKSWFEREWIGPEYRDILMMFRPQLVRHFPDRIPSLNISGLDQYVYAGQVRHYGKAISVENWEGKCDYYGEHLPEPYQTKWRNRRGKAIKHDMKSDFGSDLIKWTDEYEKGFQLTGGMEAVERRQCQV